MISFLCKWNRSFLGVQFSRIEMQTMEVLIQAPYVPLIFVFTILTFYLIATWPLQVRHLDTSEKSELHKLQLLKDEQGRCFFMSYFPLLVTRSIVLASFLFL